MRFLLDTDVFLWWLDDDPKLTVPARDAIRSRQAVVHVSAASIWEIAIKQSLGKLELTAPAEIWLPRVIARSGFAVADVSFRAALGVRALPWHHRDPFDRLLIAQAIEDGYTIATRDGVFRDYTVSVLVA